MRLLEIYERLNELSPFELQESWDNSGLLIGSMSDEVDTILLSIDLDEELIETTEAGTLFIVHHPLIFGKLTALDFDTYPANLIQKMILKKQKLIAMHTNFDQTHLNRYVAQEVLGLEVELQDGYLAYATVDTTLDALCSKIKADLQLQTVKVVEGEKAIKRVALCTGAGASMIGEVKADLFLTGDIKYHDAMMAKSLNLSMIDIGHFESERYFSEVLSRQLKDWPISVIISSSKNPFIYEK